MKVNRLGCPVVVVAVLVAAAGATAAPLGTGFIYQGQLKEDGVPFDGTADFEFSLWDAAGIGNPPTGGAQVGGVQAINALPVTAGLFAVTLNSGGEFGGNAFTGSARWLQIAVLTPISGGRFTTLAPRQPLTAAPHALFALNAASAANATTATNAGNAANANLLDNLDSTAFLQSIPVPLSLSGTSSSPIIRGENASTTNGVSGVYGSATAATNVNYGVFGQSDSTQGRGVTGVASAASGGAYGGQFQSNSTGGRGVSSRATAATGTTFGVYGESVSTSGRGVEGVGHIGVEGTATDANGYGGVFQGSGGLGSGQALFVAGDSEMLGSLKVGVGGIIDATAKVNILGGTDTAPGGGGYLVTGSTTSTNISIDDNEIMARNNGAVANLAMNGLGGNVTLIQNGSGNVGIGTAAPTTKLHVVGGTDSAPGSGGFLVTGSTNSTNISIDNNEIMARNNGQVAALTINADGGDVVFGGAIDIGWERVTHSATLLTSAPCSGDKLVLGGGCDCGTDFVLESSPTVSGGAWYCECSGLFASVTAFAICANVK